VKWVPGKGNRRVFLAQIGGVPTPNVRKKKKNPFRDKAFKFMGGRPTKWCLRRSRQYKSGRFGKRSKKSKRGGNKNRGGVRRDFAR